MFYSFIRLVSKYKLIAYRTGSGTVNPNNRRYYFHKHIYETNTL